MMNSGAPRDTHLPEEGSMSSSHQDASTDTMNIDRDPVFRQFDNMASTARKKRDVMAATRIPNGENDFYSGNPSPN